jgi:hypothetical protein
MKPLGTTKTRTRMVFVTGVDEVFFNQIFLLLGSLQRSSPSISLMFAILDYQNGNENFCVRRECFWRHLLASQADVMLGIIKPR